MLPYTDCSKAQGKPGVAVLSAIPVRRQRQGCWELKPAWAVQKKTNKTPKCKAIEVWNSSSLCNEVKTSDFFRKSVMLNDVLLKQTHVRGCLGRMMFRRDAIMTSQTAGAGAWGCLALPH